jgi:5,5'-dehydrodivanillate O-demethylase
VLSQADNERLTRVGPGTPMGELYRRYWMPIAISDQVGARPVRRRLLGEDLVVFRTSDGRIGVVEERCAHRRTSLSVGFCDKNGIRCGYHGWLYGLDGKVIEQPAEPALNKQVKIKAYPAEELGGLIFTYMGPLPVPQLPHFDLFVEQEGTTRDIGEAMLDFNWLQAMENSVDPHHVEWLHGAFMNADRALKGIGEVKLTAKKHKKVGFSEFEYGIIKRRVVEGGTEEDDDWKIGHPLVFPHMLKLAGAGIGQFQIRVPIDDVNTWHLWYNVWKTPVPMPKQTTIPSYTVPLKDEDGNWIVDFIDGQDISVWAEQGRIADRTKETLGASDKGIAIYRRMLLQQVKIVEEGGDPLGVVRDPEVAKFIDLHTEANKLGDAMGFVYLMLTEQAARYSPLNRQLIERFGFLEAAAAE